MYAISNERKTENLVRDAFRKLSYYDQSRTTSVEEQKSENAAIKRLLKTASKSGKGGAGSPEFIVTDSSDPDFVLVVECKASTSRHETSDHSDPVNYAVDGAIHYANWLSKESNVIAVAVSGQSNSEVKISTFLQTKGTNAAKELKTKAGGAIKRIISWSDYIEHATFDPSVQRLRHEELMAYSRDLHAFMREHAKLTESEKPLLVSGTLIALQNDAFAKAFDAYKPEELQKQWFRAIKVVRPHSQSRSEC